MSKGIVTFALGNPIYGRFAFNLALSVKKVCPHIPIVLYYEESAIKDLDKNKLSFFAECIPMPEEYMRLQGSNNKDYFLPKLSLNKLTPFEQTLFLDADTLLFKDPFKHINEAFKFQTQAYFAYDFETKQSDNNGYDYTFWCEPERIKKTFKNEHIKRFYSLSSTYVYFEKSVENDLLFESIYDFRKRFTNPHKNFVPGGTCDELFIALGLTESGIEMQCPFVPIYFNFTEKNKPFANSTNYIYNEHVGITNGGNVQPLVTEIVYNDLVKAFSKEYGFKPFLSQNKRSVLSERRLM